MHRQSSLIERNKQQGTHQGNEAKCINACGLGHLRDLRRDEPKLDRTLDAVADCLLHRPQRRPEERLCFLAVVDCDSGRHAARWCRWCSNDEAREERRDDVCDLRPELQRARCVRIPCEENGTLF